MEITNRTCEEFEVIGVDGTGYGDPLSDVGLFGVVPVSVAVQADQHVAGLTTHSSTGRDLSEAYELVRHAR